MATKIFNEFEIPSWGTVPTLGVLADFFKNPNYLKVPNGIPSNKTIIYENDTDVTLENNVSGKNPILDYGFTQIAPNVAVVEGSTYEGKEKYGSLIGDSLWCNIANGDDYTQWTSTNLIALAATQKILILDFEHQITGIWTAAHFNRMYEIFAEVRAAHPDVYIGLWGREDAPNYPFGYYTGGAVTPTGNDIFASQYDDPSSANLTGFYGNTRANMAFPFTYVNARGNASMYYQVFQSVEVGKIKDPTVKQCPTVWAIVEAVEEIPNDNLISRVEHKLPNNTVVKRSMKLTSPPETMYNFSLLGLTVADGLYWFGTGTHYSDDFAYAADDFWNYDAGLKPITVRGIPKSGGAIYSWNYNGFVNYQAIANWQASQSPYKEIIENSNPWILPETKKSTDVTWQTGLKRRPSWGHTNKQPLIRLKYSTDLTQVVVVAMHPFGDIEVNDWNFRDPSNSSWDSTVKLVGAWGKLGLVNLT